MLSMGRRRVASEDVIDEKKKLDETESEVRRLIRKAY